MMPGGAAQTFKLRHGGLTRMQWDHMLMLIRRGEVNRMDIDTNTMHRLSARGFVEHIPLARNDSAWRVTDRGRSFMASLSGVVGQGAIK